MDVKTTAAFSLSKENLDQDHQDWVSLTPAERKFIGRVLVFLAAYSDDVAHENLLEKVPEENAHLFFESDMNKADLRVKYYSFFIEKYIQNREERNYLFEVMPSIQKKIKWLTDSQRMANVGKAVIAFAAQKEIFFSGSFAVLFWLEKRGLMKSLTSINEMMSKIQGSCTYFACLLHQRGMIRKPTQDEVLTVVKDAVAIEQEFLRDALPLPVIGMSNESLKTYVEFIADRLMVKLDCPKLYGAENPFNFIHHCPTSMHDRVNFFMKKVKESEKIKNETEPPVCSNIFISSEFQSIENETESAFCLDASF